MHAIFRNFADLLGERLIAGTLTTEDSVRYTLFAAMLGNGVAAKDVVLEFPHPAIPRAEIDAWLPDYDGRSVAIEFKYDRDPPGGKNQPKTQKAGSVFRGIGRLTAVAAITGAVSYCVYLTTAEMATYFKNPNNGHNSLYSLGRDQAIEIGPEYFRGKPKTFLENVGGEFQAKVVGVLAAALPGEYELRIFRVVPPRAHDR